MNVARRSAKMQLPGAFGPSRISSEKSLREKGLTAIRPDTPTTDSLDDTVDTSVDHLMDLTMREIRQSIPRHRSRNVSLSSVHSEDDDFIENAVDNCRIWVEDGLFRIDNFLGQWGLNCGKVVMIMSTIMFLFLVSPYFTTPAAPSEVLRANVMRIIKSNNITSREAKATLLMTGEWADGQLSEPLVICLVGTSDKLFPVMDSLTMSAALSVGQKNGEMNFVSDKTSRTDIHNMFESTFANGQRMKPRVISLFHLEKMSWDAPVALHALAEDNEPLFPKALVLLGVVTDNVITDSCETNMQRYLSSQWSSSGGHFDAITPIVNSRFDHVICL